MKLKLELFRYGTLVFGRVLEQAEELRQNESQKVRVLAKTNDFSIVSDVWPSLFTNRLSARGVLKDHDNKIFGHFYGSEEEAKEVCRTIKELVAEINSDTDADLGGIVRVM
jgi:hypothetical protein